MRIALSMFSYPNLIITIMIMIMIIILNVQRDNEIEIYKEFALFE